MLWSRPSTGSRPAAASSRHPLLRIRSNRQLVCDDGFRYNGTMVVTLTAQELSDLVRTREVDVVDVREAQEWAAGHIDGARSVPLDDLRADPDSTLPRHDGIIFVCAKGIRSVAAAKLADRLGYTTLYSLEGGTNAWAQAGLPLVADQRAAA